MRLWTSTRFYMDIKNDIGGPPPASIWAYNILPRMSTSFIKDEQHVTVAVNQFLYGRNHEIRGSLSVFVFCMDI